MQKVVIDTNVIVSALIQKSYPNLIIAQLFFERKFELCISDEVLSEYYEVLARPKFSKFTDFLIWAELLLADIDANAIKYYPSLQLDVLKDVDDNMILELAVECSADFIITGNTTDFVFSNYKSKNCYAKRVLGEL